jgi:hypothetical protein
MSVMEVIFYGRGFPGKRQLFRLGSQCFRKSPNAYDMTYDNPHYIGPKLQTHWHWHGIGEIDLKSVSNSVYFFKCKVF